MALAVLLLFIGFIGSAFSSICSFTASNTCYMDFPTKPFTRGERSENGIVCEDPAVYSQCVISCNSFACANQIIQCPRGGDQCVVNCNSDGSCDDATILTHHCKYTQLNLKWNSNAHVYIRITPHSNATLRINDVIITENDCYNISVYAKSTEIHIDCDEPPDPHKRSLLPYSTTQIVDDIDTNHSVEWNAMKVNRNHEMQHDTQLWMVTSIVLMILLIISLIICICSRYLDDSMKSSELHVNQVTANGNHQTYNDEVSSDTQTFDGYVNDGNEDIELQMADHEMYLNRMNELLCVKSISVIST